MCKNMQENKNYFTNTTTFKNDVQNRQENKNHFTNTTTFENDVQNMQETKIISQIQYFEQVLITRLNR